ncbi:hypothetical protein [Legionella saoudiensis]|uniref:hypothetical protein n=1 Tax=Legionella saoudiensis TaxID=1750561 RepID=UPI000A5B7AFB|nr:hypothetical protein [Legionella saoudiensis]
MRKIPRKITTHKKFSFFSALNPASCNSGVTYRFGGSDDPCQGKEMIDSLVSENIYKAWNSNLDFQSALYAAYEILMGEHYDLYFHGQNDCRGGAKGALDYLIFPLVARKLITDFYSETNITLSIFNVLVWSIAVPLEVARFSAAVGLTLLLTPVIALVHLLRGCFSENIQNPVNEVQQSAVTDSDVAQEENAPSQTAEAPQKKGYVRRLSPHAEFARNHRELLHKLNERKHKNATVNSEEISAPSEVLDTPVSDERRTYNC